MTINALEFENLNSQPSLSDWTATLNPDCKKTSNYQISIPTANLVSWGTPVDGKVTFSLIVKASYWSFDRIYNTDSQDNIQKEIQFEIIAPTTTVVSVSFSLHPESDFMYEKDQETIEILDDGTTNLYIDFRTFVHEQYTFDGEYKMTSDYFVSGTETLEITGSRNFVHVYEGPGVEQNWTLSLYNISCIPNTVHKETVSLELQTEKQMQNGEFFEEGLDIQVLLSDGECGPKVVNLESDPTIDWGDAQD